MWSLSILLEVLPAISSATFYPGRRFSPSVALSNISDLRFFPSLCKWILGFQKTQVPGLSWQLLIPVFVPTVHFSTSQWFCCEFISGLLYCGRSTETNRALWKFPDLSASQNGGVGAIRWAAELTRSWARNFVRVPLGWMWPWLCEWSFEDQSKYNKCYCFMSFFSARIEVLAF